MRHSERRVCRGRRGAYGDDAAAVVKRGCGPRIPTVSPTPSSSRWGDSVDAKSPSTNRSGRMKRAGTTRPLGSLGCFRVRVRGTTTSRGGVGVSRICVFAAAHTCRQWRCKCLDGRGRGSSTPSSAYSRRTGSVSTGPVVLVESGRCRLDWVAGCCRVGAVSSRVSGGPPVAEVLASGDGVVPARGSGLPGVLESRRSRFGWQRVHRRGWSSRHGPVSPAGGSGVESGLCRLDWVAECCRAGAVPSRVAADSGSRVGRRVGSIRRRLAWR